MKRESLSAKLGSIAAVVGDDGTAVQRVWYFASGLPVTENAATTAVNSRLHIGKEFTAFDGLWWYDNDARQYDPLTMRFTTLDPLAANYPSLSPYAYCANNPVNYIDPDGRANFMYNGEIVGNDGVNDNRLLAIKTNKKSFRNSGEFVKGAGFARRKRKKMIKYIRENSGNTEAFSERNDIYNNTIEVEPNADNRSALVAVVSRDDGKGGTGPDNNREYGGYLDKEGVHNSPPGEVSTQGNPVSIVIRAPREAPLFHSHPSGSSNAYDQPPSKADIDNAGTGANYCFARGNGKVYIYDKDGVQAVYPMKYFVNPKIRQK